MLHRLVLAATGLMMMFTVFGGVMFIGSFGEIHAETAIGNGILTTILLVVTVTMLIVGMRMRSAFNTRLHTTIQEMFSTSAAIEASDFATRTHISLDSAREFLDKQAALHGWDRVESAGYNARYTR